MRPPVPDDARFMDLFELAALLPPDQRRVRLAAIESDEAIVQDVLEKVAWHDRMGDFLLEPAVVHDEGGIGFAPGQVIAGRFRIVREIGAGGMGVVYEAFDSKLGQPCALKCARPGFAPRLPAEARSALSITHHNVCRVYGIHTVDTAVGPVDVLAMEFLDGETLSSRLARAGPIDPTDAADIARQIAQGLDAAHRRGILHRDLKSTNIMLTPSDDGRVRAVITDFGLAVPHDARGAGGPSRSGDLAGTVAYMAPELFAGARAGLASDIYAFGVVLYEMVTGRPPNGDHPGRGFPSLPSRIARVDRRWDRAVRLCLAEDPRDRAACAADVVAVLGEKSRLAEVWTVALVVLTAALIAFTRAGGAPQAQVRIAILPVSVGPDDEELSRLAGGAMHDLTDRFLDRRQSPRLLVIPLAEAVAHKVSDVRSARARLGATHALTGTITRRDGKLVVAADLIDTGTEVTAARLRAAYAPADFDAVPAALAATLMSAFGSTLESPEPEIAPDAYPFYAQGLAILRERPDAAERAAGFLERAAGLDRRSALPLATWSEALAIKYQLTRDRRALDAAIETLAAAQARRSDLTGVVLASARVHRILGMHDRAADEFGRVLAREPENVIAWIGLARTREQQGRHAEAATAYQTAVDLHSGYYLPRLEFGNFYHLISNYELAERHLRSVVDLAPELPLPHAALGAIYVSMGRWADAEKALARSIELGPSVAALNNLGALFNFVGRDREALTLYEEQVQANPSDFVLWTNIADSRRRLGLADAARAAYREGLLKTEAVLRVEGADGYARAFLAYFLARLGNGHHAREEIAQALGLAPDDGRVLKRAVHTFVALDDPGRAIELLPRMTVQAIRELARHPDLPGLAREAAFQAHLNAPGR